MQKTERLALSITEVAEALNVSRPTIYRLIQRADFPVIRLGRRQLVPRQGLEEWLRNQTGGGDVLD